MGIGTISDICVYASLFSSRLKQEFAPCVIIPSAKSSLPCACHLKLLPVIVCSSYGNGVKRSVTSCPFYPGPKVYMYMYLSVPTNSCNSDLRAHLYCFGPSCIHHFSLTANVSTTTRVHAVLIVENGREMKLRELCRSLYVISEKRLTENGLQLHLPPPPKVRKRVHVSRACAYTCR